MRDNRFDKVLREKTIHFVCKQVEETSFLKDPFPHFVITKFLPDDVYQQLQDHFPALEHFELFAYEKHKSSDGASNRMRFQTSNKSIEQLSNDSRTFWYTLRSVFASHELKTAVFEKLSQGLISRYGVDSADVANLPGYALPEVFHETDGYSIKPHPDTRKKVVTMQLALPTDGKQEAFGTEFYRRSLNPAAWLREPYGFDTVKRMPFLPNTVYAFSVLNMLKLKSWHGRSTIHGIMGIRRSLLNIWYEKAEHTCKDIVDENIRVYNVLHANRKDQILAPAA